MKLNLAEGLNTYPPAEQKARARRSSKVVGKTDVRSEAENPAAPSPPKVPTTC